MIKRVDCEGVGDNDGFFEIETAVSKSAPAQGLADTSFDFEMDSDTNGSTLCGTLMRKHRMKRHHHSKTACIYLGCNGRV